MSQGHRSIGVMGYNWQPCPVGTGRDLRGRPLRYLLVTLLAEANRPLAMPELIAACVAEGVVFDGRSSKLVSDALRWEVRNGRVVHVRRGVYQLGEMPRSTMHWIRRRTDQTRHWLRWAEGSGVPVSGSPFTKPLTGAEQELIQSAKQAPWTDDSWVRPWPYWPTSAA